MSEKTVRTKKLQPGQTKIGTIFVKDENGYVREFTLLFGNVCYPLVNGQMMSIDNKAYMEKLTDFLDKDTEGQQYLRPTVEDFDKANVWVANMQTRIEKQAEEKKEANAPEAKEQVTQEEQNEETDKTEEKVSQETGKNTSEDGKSSETNTDKNAEEKEINDEVEEDEEDSDTEEMKPKSKKMLIGLIATFSLLLISVIANAVLYVAYTDTLSKDNPTTPIPSAEPQTQAQLDIDGTIYNIPLETIEVSEGEQKIVIYAITTAIQDGKVTHIAMPLGEFDANKVYTQEDLQKNTDDPAQQDEPLGEEQTDEVAPE